jgi:hypothetical protein
VETKKPIVVKYGLNHVTYLIEQVCALLWLHTFVQTFAMGVWIPGFRFCTEFRSDLQVVVFSVQLQSKMHWWERKGWMSMNRERHSWLW